MKALVSKLATALARWRTWIVNGLLALAVVLPEIANSPEILAIVPREWQRWFLAGVFLLNIWMRPRPAVLAGDPEVQAKKVAAK
ncbi:hypothetical protein MNR02_06760 [Shinella sp. H4-D48]|uniref:hypothetical protein n=1 Tax=Shinella sp. H4-D48 TaxID=2925841 RepID=UPI001F530BDC|nr:hypothetical protein [Shinella sp. H4-D48]UNK39403.1 hypothetical protein MNR02_06760 [Shinella sp. H4-D48]